MKGPFPISRTTSHDEGVVVVGIDGSENARWALKWALDEAKLHGLLVRMVHSAVSPPKSAPPWYERESAGLSPGEAVVDDACGLAATRNPSVIARSDITLEAPVSALVDAGEAAAMLVVGARGAGGRGGPAMGSVGDECIQRASCPVIVVHDDPDELPLRWTDRTVVVGVDGTQGSIRALRWALDEARIRTGSLRAVCAWRDPPTGSEAAGRGVLDAALREAGAGESGVPFEAVTRPGPAVPALLAESEGAVLLVVGAGGKGDAGGAPLGSVAHQCAHHARCPVVVVRANRAPREGFGGRKRAVPVAGGRVR